MKKLIFTAIFAVAALSVQSQEKLRFGVKGGASFSTATGDFDGAEAIEGLHVGVLAEYRFNDDFSVQPEVQFSTQGAGIEDETVLGTTYEDQRIRLNYLNLPVLVKYHFSAVKGLSVGFGPQVGFLLSAKQKVTVKEGGDSEDQKTDVKDAFKKTDIGLAGGVEYELPINVFFGIRGNIGLSNINSDGGDKVHNSAVQISAGYRF